MCTALLGYLTVPGVALAVVGPSSPGAATAPPRPSSASGRSRVLASAAAAAAAGPIRATSRPRSCPLAGFVALGTVAALGRRRRARWTHGRGSRRRRGGVVVLLALAARGAASTRACSPTRCTRPIRASIERSTSRSIERADLARRDRAARSSARGGPYPVQIDVGPTRGASTSARGASTCCLNGTTIGAERPLSTCSCTARRAQRAGARYLITDGAHTDAPPRPGYRLIQRIARSDGGAVMRLYERAGAQRVTEAGRGEVADRQRERQRARAGRGARRRRARA